MRIVTLILATLLLVATVGLGLLGATKSLKDAKTIDDVVGSAKGALTSAAAAGDKDAGELVALGDKTGLLRAGALAFGLAGVLALGLLVMTYVGRGVPKLAIALVAAVIGAIALSPQYDLGPMAGASARSLAYVVAVIAALGALSAYGAAQLRRRAAIG